MSISGVKLGVRLVLLEKDFLRYDCYRLIDCFWLFITLLCLLMNLASIVKYQRIMLMVAFDVVFSPAQKVH